MSPSEDKESSKMAKEIVFFDVEITAQRLIKQFGAFVGCWPTLVEIKSYCTDISPKSLSEVREKSPNGLTREVLAMAPLFEEVADIIFELLHGRIWAGHNIKRHDIPLIKKAFASIGRPAPEPAGIYDTYEILRKKFGNRTVDLKMKTVASYLGLGEQKHRSLEDVRMNLEIVKRCATILFLESTFPQMLPVRSMWSSSVDTRSSEIERKSPPICPASNRLVPDQTDVLGEVMERAKKALESTPQMLPVKSMWNSSVDTRSRAIERSCSEEARRRSPAICPARNKLVPDQRDVLGKVMERAKKALRGTQGSRPLSTLLRLSRFLLR